MTTQPRHVAVGDTVTFLVDEDGEEITGVVTATNVTEIDGHPVGPYSEPVHTVRMLDGFGEWAIHPSWITEVVPMETDHDTTGMPEVLRINRPDWWLTVRDAFTVADTYVIEWGDYVTGYWQESHPTLGRVFARLAELVPAIELDTARP